jgi:hypothetical protein
VGDDVIELVSPVGYPPVRPQAERRALATPIGGRVGFIWNQYPTTNEFWTRLEQAFLEACKPSAVLRVYKPNTWSPLGTARVKEIAQQVDYLVIGVGA